MKKKSSRLTGEELLLSLGISSPSEIDVEAIAAVCNAKVQYRALSGCEAMILGVGNKAIITVNENSYPARQRFSIAHELGHWCNDRGRVASHSCDKNRLFRAWSPLDPEHRANRFASELLLPEFMLKTLLRGKDVTFSTVQKISTIFTTSLTATAIRVVQIGDYPSIVLLCTSDGIKWHVRNSSVPKAFFIERNLSEETGASQLLSGRCADQKELSNYLPSYHWCSVKMKKEYDVLESSYLLSSNCVLTLLWWQDESQIVDFESMEDEGSDSGSWRW